MLRDGDSPERRIEKLVKINAALMARLERIEESRGPNYALTRTAAVLEREVLERNRDLEVALSDLAVINQQLIDARESADRANRSKTRFLRAASHDLLQPLSAAKLFLHHLGDLSVNSMQRDLVSHLTATIDSAEELIHALSNFARLESNSLQLNRTPVSIGRLFHRMMIDLQPLARSRGVDLRFVFSTATVESDPVYLRQITQNLIANALKYTTGKKVLVGLRRAGEHIWLEVWDEGPGIASKDHDRIFVEFERLSQADQPGTGLGLSIVKRACEQLGHKLELHSKMGSGSRFRVRLPVIDPRALAQIITPLTGDPAVAHTEFENLRVLLVENDPGMSKALSYLLSAWGIKVTAASDVASARLAASQTVPDLILTDYRLDGEETGVHVLQALSEDLEYDLPALILSAEHAGLIRAECTRQDVPIMAKPVSELDLAEAIRITLKDLR